MELFNIGIPELLFVLLVMLIVMGPKDMAANAHKLARWLRRVSQSETWRMVRDTTKELRELPTQLMREAGVEEWQDQVGRTLQPGMQPRRPVRRSEPANPNGNKILPPAPDIPEVTPQVPAAEAPPAATNEPSDSPPPAADEEGPAVLNS